MKKVLLIASMALSLSACGITEQLNNNCTGSDLEGVCTLVFGGVDRDQQAQIDQGVKESEYALNARLTTLQMLVSVMNQAVSNLMITTNQSAADIASNSSLIQQLQAEINNVTSDVINLQTQLTELATGDTVTEMIDPCGASPGYNEVLLRTGSGKTVAYFEQGSKRFLSVIGQGSYQTTVASACLFTVNSLGQVCSLKSSVMVCE